MLTTVEASKVAWRVHGPIARLCGRALHRLGGVRDGQHAEIVAAAIARAALAAVKDGCAPECAAAGALVRCLPSADGKHAEMAACAAAAAAHLIHGHPWATAASFGEAACGWFSEAAAESRMPEADKGLPSAA
ncbi:conserved protein of unknown function (plasmid) [Rhodovastum atsumiense]|uniref:Uncharacterized protein n=1 Tax=Rhodovastum atsumiense TaxID=504468 RepID=A0A5M6IWT6_9PROT|nr:hypothetical protein [Rhodovastum atsumiense]KAA5611835.1 hypothetical protein F1189_12420 [Rhodovastum atsumiense]CAH2606051.1 conserved protein of unknown function [Rhodovastum atsumiense]